MNIFQVLVCKCLKTGRGGPKTGIFYALFLGCFGLLSKDGEMGELAPGKAMREMVSKSLGVVTESGQVERMVS